MDSNVIGLDYKLAKTKSQLIKVIGVGGGGGNAVNYMYQQGITDVSFALCNTDQWALSESPIETKIQLGTGLGAGGRPMVSQEAAENAKEEIESMLEEAQMVFITASMGGGTGTGAAPIIARIAKEKKILTVGVVSVPFAWEGKKKFKIAYEGVIELSKNVDALLVIQNSKLKDAYPDLTFKNALGKVNEVLCQAVKGIAEIITVTGYINLDFADVDSTMRNGGFVLMNIGEGEGEDRVGKALKNALDSPLVQDTGYQRAKRMLFNLYCSEDFPQEEIETFVDFMEQMDEDIELIWGVTFDNELGDKVKITLIVTGFGSDVIPEFKELNESADLTSDEKENGDSIVDNVLKRLKNKTSTNRLQLEMLDDLDRLEELETTPAIKRMNLFVK